MTDIKKAAYGEIVGLSKLIGALAVIGGAIWFLAGDNLASAIAQQPEFKRNVETIVDEKVSTKYDRLERKIDTLVDVLLRRRADLTEEENN